MSDLAIRPGLSLRARLLWLGLLWLSVALVFVPPVLFEIGAYASYRAAYTGTCGPHAPDIAAHPCTEAEYLAEHGAGFAGVGHALVQMAWLSLGVPVLLLWAVALLVLFVRQLQGGLRSLIRSEIGPWTAGFLAQSSLNVAALIVLIGRSELGSGFWAFSVALAAASLALYQLLWFVPLVSLGLLAWPRVVPGLVAGAGLCALSSFAVLGLGFTWLGAL